MKHLLFLVLPAVLLAGCSEHEPEADAGPGRDGVIRIASAIEASAETRAAVTDGDRLTDVQFLRVDVADDGAVPSDYFSGVTAIGGTRDNTGAKSIVFDAPTPAYSLNDDRSYFVAYHPKTTVASGVAAWTIDGKTDILMTPVWDAGKYSAPRTGGGGAAGDPMLFRHQLAQLEVICKAYTADGTAESLVQALWGDITSIELLNTASEATYTYATNAVAYNAPKGLPLLAGATYADAFAPTAVTVNAADAVTAAGMFAPDVTPGSTARIQLRVRSTGFPAGVRLEVQLKNASGADVGFTRGLKHTVTLSLRAGEKQIDVAGITITPWGAGYAGNSEMEFPTPPAVGDYYYSDGTTSKKLDVGKTAEGIVFWVNPDNPKHYKVMALGTSSGEQWASSEYLIGCSDYSDGRTNSTKIKASYDEKSAAGSITTDFATAFPAAAYCYNYTGKAGTDAPDTWYLPARNELEYLWCAYNDAAPVLWDSTSPVSANSASQQNWTNRIQAANGAKIESYGLHSSTEYDTSSHGHLEFGHGDIRSFGKGNYSNTRCIREILPPPSVKDYYYSDGSTSQELDAAKTVEGIIFWVDPANPDHFKVMSLDEVLYMSNWSKTLFDVGTGEYAGIRDGSSSGDVDAPARRSGKVNREILGRWLADNSANTTGKTIADFPKFLSCDQLGAGWYLPAVNELQYFYCSYHGYDPTTTWAAGDSPNAPDYTVKDTWDRRFEAAGCIYGFGSDLYYSSTEYDSDKAWLVRMYTGETMVDKKNLGYPARCIKEID